VTALVAAAPSLAGWKIIAFRQRGGLELFVEIGERKLAPDDLWFRAATAGERVDLAVYVQGFGAASDATLKQAGYLLLDNALGEYDVETKIGPIEWRALPADPAGAGLTPLRRLPEVVDAMAGPRLH
jgi:hypothetical protein